VEVFGITGEDTAALLRLSFAAKYGHTVPAFLTMPDGVVASVPDGGLGEFLLGGLQFLQANDVGGLLFEPAEQDGKASVDPIDIIGGDFHTNSVKFFYARKSNIVKFT